MMRQLAFPCIFLLLVLAAGCSQEKSGQDVARETAPAVQQESLPLTPAQQEIVDKAVAIAKAIEESPDAAAAVLAKFSISEEDLNGIFYEIAASPALTTAYQEALGE